ncbi:NADH-dependent flavin oxidoreductase [Loigolactobacillus zhaoyuanensis]|uniref:NADH-dependent flavin oxidoreductase n=1 Tax=Loigolactobacillus zhaoyuanensis TaxID=2486017 RepID=UPI000F736694|nr:NADH-dependent flavin oxidoreductase [Loigolactobacillus zhaoyuanensis]
MKNYPKLQQTFTLNNGVVLKNKIVMAPMTTWSSNEDQTVSNAEVSYYGARANSAGMVITGSSHVQENGVGFANELGVYADRFIPGLTKLATAIKAGGAKAIIQLNHAGDKALPQFISDKDVVSASPVPAPETAFAPAQTPRALTEYEILQVIKSFGAATKRAIQAGFDGIEIHGAHGFLVQNFLSPHYNQRTDRWGGSLENRLRFAMAVVDEVKQVAAEYADDSFIIGYRITLEEPEADGLRLVDTQSLIEHLIEKQVSYLHLSLGDAVTSHSHNSGNDEPFIQLISKQVAQRVPLIAAGALASFEKMETALADGLDLVAVGQALVANPDLFNHEQLSLTLAASKIDSITVPKTMFAAIKRVGAFTFKLVD